MIDFLFFFLLIFGYKIGYIDYSILLPGFILLCHILLYQRLNIKLPKILTLIFLFLILTVFISFISMTYSQENLVAEYSLKPLRIILFMYILWAYIDIKHLTFFSILKNISYIVFAHAIVIYIQFSLAITGIEPGFLYNPIVGIGSPFRAVGFGTGYPNAGIIILLGSLVNLYLCFNLNSNKFKAIFLISFAAIFFTARSAMYLFLLIIPTYLTYLSFYYRRFNTIILFTLTVTLIASTIYFFYLPVFQGVINKIFANVINFYNIGNFHDYSSEALFSERHIYFPNDIKTFLIGDYLGRENGFKTSDMGLIGVLNGSGFIILFIYILIYSIIYWQCYTRLKSIYAYPLKFLLILVYFVLFIMQFKTNLFFARVGGDLILIISFIFIYARFNDKVIYTITKEKS